MTNRTRLARKNAGLTLGQAARITGIDITVISRIELKAEAPIDPTIVVTMCDVYGVNPEWLTGSVPQYNYATVDKMKGADKICDHDRDMVAEFAASMRRK